MVNTERIFKKIYMICIMTVLIFSLTGCGNKSPLDPKNPVSLTVWHYYNGSE